MKIWGFETVFSTLLYVKDKRKTYECVDIHDQNTLYVFVSKALRICI